MSRIHSNHYISQGKLTLEQSDKATSPSPKWVKARLNVLAGGNHRAKESMKKRIEEVVESKDDLTNLFLKRFPQSA